MSLITSQNIPIPEGLTVAGTKGDGKGRSLVATRAFSPGEQIAAFEDPLLALPAAAAAQRVCNQCLAHAVPVRLCTGCRCVAYCSAGCQRAHWAAVHARECRVFRTVRRETGHDWLPTPVRALTQLLLRWGTGGGDGDGTRVREALAALEDNADRFEARETMWRDLSVQAIAAMVYAGWKQVDDNMRLGRGILCKIQTNSFDRSDADTGQTGTFLDPTLAMVNHSCVPNAVVCFVKRKAYLRAESEIKAGDEITISYIDYTKPKPLRQRALELYHFECKCPRCRDDLNVYQVCQMSSSLIPLNSFSVVPDQERLRNPPYNASMASHPSFKARLTSIYEECSPETETPREARLARLRFQWKQCRPLVEARMWAASPLDQTIEAAATHFADNGSYAHALSVACFSAMNCDPVKYVAPFKQWRLKGLMIVAKTVTNTAPSMTELEKTSHRGVVEVLQRADQVSICEAILLMVVAQAPKGHSEEWEVLEMARVMLKDIESLKGREITSGLLHAWAENHEDPEGKAFFEQGVLKPMEELAGFALEILTAELEGSGVARR